MTGKSLKFRRNNEKIISIIVILIILIVFAAIINIIGRNSGSIEPEEIHEDVKPSSEYSRDVKFTELSLSRKAWLGGDKFGFQKTLIIEQKTAVSQYIEEEPEMKNLYYGIYKDKKLEIPIVEVDVGYNRKAEAAIEDGADDSDYENYRPGFCIVLEPGTYYISVYTDKLTSLERFKYLCTMVCINQNAELKEGRKQECFFADKKQVSFFKITAAKDGRIVVNTQLSNDTKIQLCSESKTPVSQVYKSKRKYDSFKPEYNVKKGQTYYVRITNTQAVEEAWSGLHPTTIEYKYIDK